MINPKQKQVTRVCLMKLKTVYFCVYFVQWKRATFCHKFQLFCTKSNVLVLYIIVQSLCYCCPWVSEKKTPQV